MPRTEEVQVYSFEELDDSAKETAREWYRQGACDYEWWDGVYYDFEEVCKCMGIEVDNIYFSGFYCQGDGACFEGKYLYRTDTKIAIANHAPQDTELLDIAERLDDIQRKRCGRLGAKIKHSGRYNHEYCMDITVHEDGFTTDYEPVAEVVECMRDLARWLYRRLEAEYEWINSNESVDVALICDEYEFTEDGARWV